MLTQQEGELLVKLARRAVEGYLESKQYPEVSKEIPEKLMEPCGVFVTINRIENGEKELRGCIGQPYPTEALARAVIDSAINSATQDPRFNPLSPSELGEIVFEVSVLTPPQLVEVRRATEYPSKIKVGEDGLIVEKGIFKGLLLPQVPVEWNWNEEEFLCQCSLKAGQPPDCWLTNGTKIYKFQAMIFAEEKPRGKIRRKTFGGT